MALGVLAIYFYTVVILGFGGLVLLYFIKNEKVKNILFYFLTALGLFMSFEGFISVPTNDIIGKVILAIAGLFGLAGIVLKVKLKKYNIAYIFLAICVIVPILKIFTI